MDYKPYSPSTCDYDDFIVRSFFTTNPSLTSLQEVILMLLQELSYYLLKLKDFGAENDEIKNSFIEALSGIITNVDYNHEQFKNIVIELIQDLSQVKTLYAKFCKENNVESFFIKPNLKNAHNATVNELIQKGEKHYINRNVSYSTEQKNMFDIIIHLSKRLCFKIVQTESYNINYDDAYKAILTLLNTLNTEQFDVTNVKATIQKCNKSYTDLLKALYTKQEELYGPRGSVNIPFSPRNGKAILVSGIDMRQLELVLKATENRDVDVYTHGMTMLMAHTLEKFRQYPHLVGHFGKGSENSLFDFAAFPGAILMTRYLFQKVDYLYKGRLFTTDSFAPVGIVKIQGNDFEPLIQSALNSKGFTKGEQEKIMRVGFKQNEMLSKINELTEKLKNNEIRHVYFIGILHHESEYKDYFNKFLEIMPKDCYAITLSHDKSAENILHVDSFYDYLLSYQLFDEMKKIKSFNPEKITVFITKCDQYTITNLINLLNNGIKSIYLSECLPSLINPSMYETLKKVFAVKSISNPKEDLKETLDKEKN